MLSKTVSPKTKAELLRALQAASFRFVKVFEGDSLNELNASLRTLGLGSTVVVLTR